MYPSSYFAIRIYYMWVQFSSIVLFTHSVKKINEIPKKTSANVTCNLLMLKTLLEEYIFTKVKMLCFQLLKRWHDRRSLTVRELMEDLVTWQRGGCLDPRVWDEFLRPRISPSLMPAPSVLRLPPPPTDPLQIEFVVRFAIYFRMHQPAYKNFRYGSLQDHFI